VRKRQGVIIELRRSVAGYADALSTLSNLWIGMFQRQADLADAVRMARGTNMILLGETRQWTGALEAALRQQAADTAALAGQLDGNERTIARLAERVRTGRERSLWLALDVAKAERALATACARRDMLGLRITERNIVFLVDSSASMAAEHRLDDVKGAFKVLLSSMAKRGGYRADIVQYCGGNGTPLLIRRCWGRMVAMNEQARKQAIQFVADMCATGNTPTVTAVTKAFDYDGVDAIVLLSDGEPTDYEPPAVALTVITNCNAKALPIHCVGVGSGMKNAASPARMLLEDLARSSRADCITF
jgi:Mg-chelatase subunit ChlD